MSAALPNPSAQDAQGQAHASACLEVSTDRRRFTPDQADRTLPYVRAIVADVQRQYGEILELRKRMATASGSDAGGSPGDPSPTLGVQAYEAAMDRLGELVDELHGVGVELRDFELGLIAFPCEHEGRTVLLSWQPGEASVRFFHEQDESVAERRPFAA